MLLDSFQSSRNRLVNYISNFMPHNPLVVFLSLPRLQPDYKQTLTPACSHQSLCSALLLNPQQNSTRPWSSTGIGRDYGRNPHSRCNPTVAKSLSDPRQNSWWPCPDSMGGLLPNLQHILSDSPPKHPLLLKHQEGLISSSWLTIQSNGK